ncbi:MAG: DJ-1/PfpI family protein [Elusimicrobiota bacterium]
MKKIIFFISVFMVMSMCAFTKPENVKEADMADVKKIILVIANEGFRDEEYLEPKRILEGKGIKVVTAAKFKQNAHGKLGAVVNIDEVLDNIKMADYDGIFFIGGPGCKIYWNDQKAHALLNEAVNQGKVIGSICSGGATLAYAGVLEGKNANSFKSEQHILREHGANVLENPVVVDGKIVTASGPAAAKEFGKKILKMIIME